MRLSELLYDELIKIGLEAEDKWETIEELVDLLISSHELRMSDREQVIEALFARERSLSTGMEHGLAVPHAVVTCVDNVIAAMGTCQKGIPFESLDGNPAHLFVLLLIPKGAFQAHLDTLAGIAKLSSIPEIRKRMIEAGSPDELMAVIYENDEDIDAK